MDYEIGIIEIIKFLEVRDSESEVVGVGEGVF